MRRYLDQARDGNDEAKPEMSDQILGWVGAHRYYARHC